MRCLVLALENLYNDLTQLPLKHGNLKPENIYLYVDKQGCLKAGLTDPHLQLMFEEPQSDSK